MEPISMLVGGLITVTVGALVYVVVKVTHHNQILKATQKDLDSLASNVENTAVEIHDRIDEVHESLMDDVNEAHTKVDNLAAKITTDVSKATTELTATI